jgi:hypothetical protein
VAKSAPTPRQCPAWFVQVAEEMARNNSALKVAALDIGVTLDPAEAERIGRRKDFQEILRIERNKYHAAVGNDPTRTKSTVIGMMWIAAERLAREGEHEKSAQVLERVAKIEGWAGADTNVNVFGDLTAKDLNEAQKKLEERIAGTKQEALPN